MRLKPLSNSAMTLAELIITSVLVGIVTLGLIAAEHAVRISRQASNRDSQISTQLQAMLLQMSKDASLTVGDFASPGIYLKYLENNTTNNLQAICFRHAAGDVNSYADDRWFCWTFDSTNNVVSNCGDLSVAIFSEAADFSSCTGRTDEYNWTSIPLTQSMNFLITDSTGATVTFNSFNGRVIPLANQSILSIGINLLAKYQNGYDVNPISNPQYQLETNISPTGLSR